MNDFIKIREITAQYNLTARTLRYYEDMGLIESVRKEDYAYRMYDAANVKRLEQILILRKLNISIKDIKRIFSTSGSEVVLEVLGKKVDDIDGEISLLHELREIVLEFIWQIESADFGREDDVKRLYEKAKEIKTQIAHVDYSGNPADTNRLPAAERLLAVTEKLDTKIPDIMIVRIPKFRALTSGLLSFEELFGGDFEPWQEAHNHLFRPVIFDAPDFLCEKDGKVEWLWAVKEGVTKADTAPYEMIEFPGGLYAVSVSVDGDGESHDKVQQKVEKWLLNTNFVLDGARGMMGHMIYVDDEIKEGLGYHQMNLYAPVKLRR